jgi:4'-phosphopantetheinyl transferase
VFLDRITDPETLQAYESLLSPEEDARYRRFAFARNRQQFLVGRALVRTTLSRYAGVPPAAWVFAASGHGKPEIAAPADFAGLRFNLSHTDGLVACAVTAGREVGVDVEDMSRREVSASLARYCLSAAELAHWEGLSDGERREVFFDYWTLKEAYIKARGLGLSVPLHDFSFRFRVDGPPAISFASGFGDDPAGWHFSQFQRSGATGLTLVIREIVPALAGIPHGDDS